jgi:hypothetical protein
MQCLVMLCLAQVASKKKINSTILSLTNSIAPYTILHQNGHAMLGIYEDISLQHNRTLFHQKITQTIISMQHNLTLFKFEHLTSKLNINT